MKFKDGWNVLDVSFNTPDMKKIFISVKTQDDVENMMSLSIADAEKVRDYLSALITVACGENNEL